MNSKITHHSKKDAAKTLQTYYRTYVKGQKLNTEEALAYESVRMPATKAVIDRVLDELPIDYQCTSFLDVGCGTGAASLSVYEKFPDTVTSITGVDYSPAMVESYKKVLSTFPPSILTTAKPGDACKIEYTSTSLVGISYVLTELKSEGEVLTLLNRLWAVTQDYCFVILPGTSYGFKTLLTVRDWVLHQDNATLMAPCPHSNVCPLSLKEGDWCHFKVRVCRTKDHIHFKDGTLPYEDEPYCYLLIKKGEPVAIRYDRIIKKPRKYSGHLTLDLCQRSGLNEQITYSKKDKELYKICTKKKWGDRIEDNE